MHRIIGAVAGTGATMLTGMTIERMAHTTDLKGMPAVDPTAVRGGGLWPDFPRTGNQRLDHLSSRIAPGQEGHIARDALRAQIEKRADLANDVSAVAKNPTAAIGSLQSGLENLRKDIDTFRGALKVAAGGASITPAEAASVAGACARDTAAGAYSSAKAAVEGAYAVATTSPKAVEHLTGAIEARAKRDATRTAAGLLISNAAAAVLGAVPHPAAKLAASGIAVTGKLAAGAQLSKAFRNAGGADDDSATKQQLANILRSKIVSSAS